MTTYNIKCASSLRGLERQQWIRCDFWRMPRPFKMVVWNVDDWTLARVSQWVIWLLQIASVKHTVEACSSSFPPQRRSEIFWSWTRRHAPLLRKALGKDLCMSKETVMAKTLIELRVLEREDYLQVWPESCLQNPRCPLEYQAGTTSAK